MVGSVIVMTRLRLLGSMKLGLSYQETFSRHSVIVRKGLLNDAHYDKPVGSATVLRV
jgi:hypothetical protein